MFLMSGMANEQWRKRSDRARVDRRSARCGDLVWSAGAVWAVIVIEFAGMTLDDVYARGGPLAGCVVHHRSHPDFGSRNQSLTGGLLALAGAHGGVIDNLGALHYHAKHVAVTPLQVEHARRPLC